MSCYVGRFAPSPTGPLHLGSLICALASYLDARHQAGRWLVRMEDLDPPREQPGAAEDILDSLRQHGLEWDGSVLWQSQRLDAYAAVAQELLQQNRAFPCDCTRRQLAADGGVYRGRCRQRQLSVDGSTAIRLRVEDDKPITIRDRIQQPLQQRVSTEIGDFIIQRRDQLYAYQLAVVVDDQHQGITHVLRGADLYDSTPRQIYLQQVLRFPRPDYCHIPVITNPAGHKMSKQTGAAAISSAEVDDNLRLVLKFLDQKAPPAHYRGPRDILAWATQYWNVAAIPARPAIPETLVR